MRTVRDFLSEAVKMPRVIYKSEIRKHFSDNYKVVLNIFTSAMRDKVVKGDDGQWYSLTKVDATASQEARLKVKKAKAPK